MDSTPHASPLLAGRYRLIGLAGQGGMAEVWRGEVVGSEGFRRPVAIKSVRPELLDRPLFREMFIEESRIGAALDHPNVVQVFDFVEDSRALYLVMEWVDGITLRELAQGAACSGVSPAVALVAAIGIEVLHGLEAAHTHGWRRSQDSRVQGPILHRDVSPSNVIVARRGVVKLTDFGLARALDRARTTPDGMVKGKLAYLAPEQLRGRPASVRTDIYSCGVVLWELMCGRRMFYSMTDAEVVRFKLGGECLPRVRSVRAEVPECVALAIDSAVSPCPEQRFGSAAEFARVLGDGLRTLPERTDPARIAAEVAIARRVLARRDAREKRGSGPGISTLSAVLDGADEPRTSGERTNEGATTVAEDQGSNSTKAS